MSECSFLSNKGEKIQCFVDCAFYGENSNGETCPFNNIPAEIKLNRSKRKYDYINISEELIPGIEEYEDSDYLEEL